MRKDTGEGDDKQGVGREKIENLRYSPNGVEFYLRICRCRTVSVVLHHKRKTENPWSTSVTDERQINDKEMRKLSCHILF